MVVLILIFKIKEIWVPQVMVSLYRLEGLGFRGFRV